ncbi:MAG: hypothetical protein NTW20_18645 [Rhodobacterales bacterium]|nr:hypothetical protein [Rhodobacterales bacterium]
MRFIIASICALGLSGSVSADDFYDHPASDVMGKSEKTKLPQFNGRDSAYRNFRTRIVNGCGTSCIFAYVADARTGEVFPFPYGGEENYEMSLDYRLESRLVRVTWADLDSDACITHEIAWNGATFDLIGEARTKRIDICNK